MQGGGGTWNIAHLRLPLTLCPSALGIPTKVLRASHSRVPVAEILDTQRFSLGLAQEAPGWIAELNAWEAEQEQHRHHHREHDHHHEHDGQEQTQGQEHGHGQAGSSSSEGDASRALSHASATTSAAAPAVHAAGAKRLTETEKYGIASFVYHAVRPFHPGRLLDTALSTTWQGVLRTKASSAAPVARCALRKPRVSGAPALIQGRATCKGQQQSVCLQSGSAAAPGQIFH